jgi:hypothetical protein
VYLKHQRIWASEAARAVIPEDDDNELLADLDADAEVMELLLQHWTKALRRRLIAKGGVRPEGRPGGASGRRARR